MAHHMCQWLYPALRAWNRADDYRILSPEAAHPLIRIFTEFAFDRPDRLAVTDTLEDEIHA